MPPRHEGRSESKVTPLHAEIHPTAVIDTSAELGHAVKVGPYAVVGADVSIGDGTEIGAHAVIHGPTRIGKRNRIYSGAYVGNDPQDLKYKGERTTLWMGDENIVRESASISRGTAEGGGETRIGNGTLVMTCTHVAHDCKVGNHVVLAHGSGLAGHVTVEDAAVIGGMVGVHQFSKVGRMAMIGAHSYINKDVPPFVLVSGNPARVHGLNVVGLRRNGIDPDVRVELKHAFKILYRSDFNVQRAIDEMEQSLSDSGETIEHLLRFLRSSDRGICR